MNISVKGTFLRSTSADITVSRRRISNDLYGKSDGLSSCPSCTAAPASEGTQVLGASTGGQVLGASTDTLAATGSFDQTFRLMFAVLSGFAAFAIGVYVTRRHEIS